MTEDTDTDEKSMSRRSVLSAGGVVAGGWLVNKLTGGAVSVAKAQQSQEYRIEFAPDDITTWAIDDEVQGDGTTDLIIKHVPSDTTVRWDRSEGSFDFSQIQSFVVDSLTADSATVNNDLTADSLSVDSASIGDIDWQSIPDATVTAIESGSWFRTTVFNDSSFGPSETKTIANVHPSAKILVNARQDNSNTNKTTDVLTAQSFNSFNRDSELSTSRGSPGDLIYNVNGTDLELSLNNTSTVHNVHAIAWQFTF